MRSLLSVSRPARSAAGAFVLTLALLVPATAFAGEPAATGESSSMKAMEEGASAPDFVPGRRNPDAPKETEQFGRLVGIWDIRMSVRQGDGSWSKPEDALRAEWRFRYILDGWAIQDEWIAPPSGVPVKEGIRQLGTNIRIYDPKERAWDVAWISNTQQTLSTLTAKKKRGRLVMTGQHPNGKPQRVTFYDVTDTTFDWTLELQGLGNDPDAWVEVARIHAVKRAGVGADR